LPEHNNASLNQETPNHSRHPDRNHLPSGGVDELTNQHKHSCGLLRGENQSNQTLHPMKTYVINNFSIDPHRPYHVAYETEHSLVTVGDFPTYQEAIDAVPEGSPCYHYVSRNLENPTH